MTLGSIPQLPQAIVIVLERFGVNVEAAAMMQGGSDAIVYVQVTRRDAVDIWYALRALVPDSQLWPVLLGGDTAITAHESNISDQQDMTTDALILKAQSMDIAAWLAEEKARLLAAWERLKEEDGPEFAEFYDHEPVDDDEGLHGPWPDDIEPNTMFYSPTRAAWYESQTMMYLGLVPATEGWQVPIFLRFDFGNDAPSPAAHAAHALMWWQEYGAEIVCVTPSIIEMYVVRPPRDRASALALARQQYDYCSDIVGQGTGTLEVLAALLLDSPV